MLAVATSTQERANSLLIRGNLSDDRFVVPLSLNEGATRKSENMVIPAHRVLLAIVKSTNLLTEEETKEVLNNFADNRWSRSSVFATPEAYDPHLKEEFFITVGRYGMSLTKSCLLDKNHSVEHVSLMKLSWFILYSSCLLYTSPSPRDA